MKARKQWSLLRLFGAQVEGEIESTSVPTPQTNETGETENTAPVAEEQRTEARKEDFKRLMEGEYKDLFTAYFQETFNRRFREQKELKSELEQSRALVQAAADHFGVQPCDLIEAIRTENERKNASAEIAASEQRAGITEEALQQAVETAVAKARLETEARLLAGIRARGLRPTENALVGGTGTALRADASRLSRAQRAEIARRAAEGERIKL